MRGMVHPASCGLVENPKPGSTGITRWNAWLAFAPWAAGSVSGPMTLRNSSTDPGHPWVMTRGVAFASGDRTWRKSMSRPSIVVRCNPHAGTSARGAGSALGQGHCGLRGLQPAPLAAQASSFLLCGWWLAKSQSGAHRLDRAAAMGDLVLFLAGHLG